MGENLTRKIISEHLVSGEMSPGKEIGLRMDQTLTQDATGTMACCRKAWYQSMFHLAMGSSNTSTLPRAARALAISMDSAEALMPGSDLEALAAWLAERAGKYERIAWVGHAPDVGRLTAAMIGTSQW